MFCVKDNASNKRFRALTLLIFVQYHLKFFDLGLIVSSWANTSVHFQTLSNFPLLIPSVTCPNRPLSEARWNDKHKSKQNHSPIHHHHLLTEHLTVTDSLRPVGVHALITHWAPWHFLLGHIFVILSDFDAYCTSHTFTHSILFTVKVKLRLQIWKLEETIFIFYFFALDEMFSFKSKDFDCIIQMPSLIIQ